MTVDAAIVVAIISALTTILINFGSKMISSRVERAQESRDLGDAATKLSDAAALQIKTYNEEIVTPLTNRITGLETENATLRTLLGNEGARHEEYRRVTLHQIEELQLKAKHLNVSLESQREQIVILIQQSESKDRTIKRMQEEIEQLQRENASLRDEITELRSENHSLKTRPIGG